MEYKVLQVLFPFLTLMSPVSLSLYWSPVTQPSSSSKVFTVPSMNVTLGGAIYTVRRHHRHMPVKQRLQEKVTTDN